MSTFNQRRKAGKAIPGTIQAFRKNLEEGLRSENVTIDPDVSRATWSNESFHDSIIDQALDTVIGLESTIKTAFSSVGEKGESVLHITDVGIEAAANGAMLTGSLAGYASAEAPVLSGPGQTLVLAGSGGVERQVLPSLEAYDNRQLRDTQMNTILFNGKHGAQSPFAEAFFSTVVVPNDKASYAISINVTTVFEEVRHGVTGDVIDMKRRNIIHGVIDPSVYGSDHTLIVPAFRAGENAGKFVPVALLPTQQVTYLQETVETSALRINEEIGLIGLSQTDALLEHGLLDHSDALDTAIFLQNIYIAVGAAGSEEVFKIMTQGLPFSNFTPPAQGQNRDLVLNFNSTNVRLKGTKDALLQTVRGTDTVALAALGEGDYSVRLKLNINGNANTERGSVFVGGSAIGVDRVLDANGMRVAPTNPAVKAAIDALLAGKVIGYDLHCYRTNSNRRQRGLLVNNEFYTQVYPVQLKSPITVARPQTESETYEATDVSTLLNITGARTSNDAIQKLHDTADLMAAHVLPNESLIDAPTILGIAHGPLRAFYEEHEIDLTTSLNSVTSTEKADDIRNQLLLVIRDGVTRMYTHTGYQAAADARAGTQTAKPLVVIGTDPIISNWLFTNGDARSLGPDFRYKIVDTLNQTMTGMIYITFQNEAAAKAGVPDPFSFGNFAWKSEMVINLPTHFNGANHRQTTVQPAYNHVVNMPALIKLNVKGITESVRSRTEYKLAGVTIDGVVQTDPITPTP